MLFTTGATLTTTGVTIATGGWNSVVTLIVGCGITGTGVTGVVGTGAIGGGGGVELHPHHHAHADHPHHPHHPFDGGVCILVVTHTVHIPFTLPEYTLCTIPFIL